MKDDELTRREFTVASALAMLSGVTITLTGCGDSATMPTQTQPPPPATGGGGGGTGSGDRSGFITNNHGHTAVITAAELAAGEDMMLNIEGEAGHPHRVELTAAEVQQIAGGMRVTKGSTTLREDPLYPEVGEHAHNVTFN